ncbi:3'-5' exonuclease [Salimicrobium flavidum]|uniref:DNA polymerase-3 subunit epsilon/DNA polymerase-3 subunit alpha n=1 Tax=Salimicrobium flavidum TaxID=570947 RepID=A0A1N7IIQ4_9BACI|nr:3'-5' exonuclease [Salimicrobium flavidum]SIS36957.1 DNA polymerase-3 subunit epsilon/DNA polymerase-3 subunit alpha [Salimicrobium flavidum]
MIPIDLQILKYIFMEKPIYYFKMKPYFQTSEYHDLCMYITNRSDTQNSDRLDKRDYTVFDLETTGFLPEIGHEILSIGAVRMNGNSEKLDEMHQLIKPIRPVPNHILSLTNLSRDALNQAPSFLEGFQRFLTFSENSTLVAHPAHFDVRFLRAMVKRWKLPEYSPPCIDSQQMAKYALPDVSHRLDPLLHYFNIHSLERHHALNDANMTADLFSELLLIMKKEHNITTYSVLQQLLNRQKS